MRYKKFFWLITAAASVLRLLIIGRIGLSGDEAHYWTYTQYPELSYFDHPPLVAWFIKAFCSVFGNTEFAVRLPAVLIFIAVSYLMYKLAEELYGEKTAFWTIALLNVTPVFSFLGSVMMIPDAPLSLFWMLFIYLFHRMLKTGKAYYWFYLGGILGLALLSKYNAVFLPLGAALYLLFSKEDRPLIKRTEPYFAAALAFAVFLPVVIWNMRNGFASFGFQLAHGFGKTAPHFSFETLGRCLGAQAAYVSPMTFVFFWLALIWSAINAFEKKDRASLFVFMFSFPTLLVFNAIAGFNEILPHWPAMGYLMLAPAAVNFGLSIWDNKGFRLFAGAGALTGLLLCVLIPLQAMFKVVPPELLLPKEEGVKIEDGVAKAEKVDITNELYGWGEAGKKIAELIAASPEPKPFVFTHRHYIASQLSFYIPGRPRVYTLSDRTDAYDFWQRDLSALDGRDGIFVTNDYFYTDPAKVFPFSSWEKPVEMDIMRGGRKARIFWITPGKKFSLKDLPAEYTSECAGPSQTAAQCLRKMDHRVFWAINRDTDVRAINFLMWKFTLVDTTYAFNSGMVILALIVGVLLWIYRREHFIKEFLLFIGILVVGGIVVHLMKDFVGRMRPLAIFGEQVRVFHELLERGSFPSGHSQIAFSVATYLTMKFRKFWWLFYLGALAMGLSRVYIGVHFPIDVLAGALIGSFIAWAMVKLIKIKN